MKYDYKKTPLPNGGFDWIAVLRVTVGGGSKTTTPFEALIDSGSPDCLFHADVARAVGIPDITTGIHSTTAGIVTGAEMDLYAHEIRLGIGADSFKIIGKFSEQLPLAALLGRVGFFDKYVITFDPRGPTPGFELTRVRAPILLSPIRKRPT